MDQTNEKTNNQSVSDFFEGRSVFLTGASGFLGTVILETLLRCCPGIASVYILLRSKRGLMPAQRKEIIFEKKVFAVLKERSPEIFDKVHVVSGDISKPELGLNDEDLQCITEQVSVVYHCAANINLAKPIRYIMQQNVCSTEAIIDLCRKMKRFCVLVYTSSSYSNNSHDDLPIKEEVYRLPFPLQTFLSALKEQDDNKLLELTSRHKSDWPNWYCLSKCISENILQYMASDLSVAIIRPSIVGSTWKNPIPGYLDENSVFAILNTLAAERIIKVLLGDANRKLNIIPADVVANVHLMAAWSIGTKKVSSPLVVNCTSTGSLDNKWNEINKSWNQICQNFHPTKCLPKYKRITVIKNKFLFLIASINKHLLPGIIADIILKIKGEEPSVFATYYTINKFLFAIGNAQMMTPQCETINMDYLNDLLHDNDRKILDNGIQTIKLDEYMKPAVQELPSPSWKKQHEIIIQYSWLISIIRYIVLIISGCLIYWLTTVVFRQFHLI
ncbi:fatty acyl-CoA reductase 1-like isoform X2 [Argiope bruennichi]|nr:fatty acyl-CoA reductase 1-like isoform X2 [Argiope bruennichi]XP_055943925.1 fatty acyl-CoA reductase 1-like isoform X2 [Argiope bruennichi]XP_055943926.1 fatty acyl-CoA reductase 1-like isoform X2 [Argiope bruennichi]XP_055943927.1 fatty acyl-CoA reductase 1-like isoform X2 [Argiope bruennichi]